VIDTDTGYAGSLGQIFMTDARVQGLSSDLQEMNDAKGHGRRDHARSKAGAGSVSVTDVTSDGTTITVAYTVAPAASGATARLTRSFASRGRTGSGPRHEREVRFAKPFPRRPPPARRLRRRARPADG